MIKTITFQVITNGNLSDSDIKEYLEMTLGCGSCSEDNPLIDEDSDDEISCYNVEIL